MGVLWYLEIAGVAVLLVGGFVAMGDQSRPFRRVFGRMNPCYGAMESGLQVLLGDYSEPKGKRCLSEGKPGFKEILKIIAKKTQTESAEISAICCGSVWGAGSAVYETISLCTRSGSALNDRMPTREELERWLRDARQRCVSRVGFGVLMCGASLSAVPLIMRALESGNC